ncbi:unnamed protein product [Hymenolepis diminuta]|uniref:Ovule protein n=1 Tax=Hymenolepis diminuta TaxID=6216 RepID=A0A0R3SRW0_HYMDI|nr:unnamed protein product [Hymenolepis diminuta]
MSKFIVPRNIIKFSSTRFEDVYCCLNISLLHSLPNLNGLDWVPDDISCWCLDLDALSQTSLFLIPNRIFRAENGSNGDLSGRM